MKKLFFIFVLLGLMVWSGYVYAQSQTSGPATSQTPLKQRSPTRQAGQTEQKQQKTQQRCSDLTARIDQKINAYNSNADHPRLQKLNKELSTTISKLKAKGYDTSKLETELATFAGKIDACRSAYANFIPTLSQTKAFVCGQSEGQFKSTLENARKTFQSSVEPVCKDARVYLDTVLKLDLKALREQVVKSVTKTPKLSPTGSENQ